MSVLGTDMSFVLEGFSLTPGFNTTLPEWGRPLIPLTSSRYNSTPWCSKYLAPATAGEHLSQGVSYTSLCYHTYTQKAGILTSFPFPHDRLGVGLGSPNPWLTTVAKEPLPLRRHGFSPCFVATTARILVSGRSTGSQNPASALPQRSSTSPMHSH